MNFMEVSHMRNFSTCKDVMKQINIKQELLGNEHILAILSTEPPSHRSTKSLNHRSISIQNQYPLDPDGYARAISSCNNTLFREDIADIFQMANGADNLFMQQHTVPAHQQRVTKEFYDTAGGIDNHFKKKYRPPTQLSIDINVLPSIDRRPEFGRRAFYLFGARKFYWEEKDEYGVYRDDQGCARDVDGHIINVSKEDIRKLMERASRDEHIYICLPEHASSFTQTKLVPEIYTKDEINEMFYGVCGAQEKNESDFQMKLDGVYYPMNDSISWLTTCMEEMRQDIAKIHHAADKH
ncbi:hypothetical protein F2Q68_00005061 [Brassica cretica]|uniref:Uncharacterized protein n=2 Tax=Brassica cretica TaxID=69181 RepID=A0A8S9J7Q5_BRACR|nr:hypothetical protein F2Q68_00005061 [Brassica cretica]KAF3547275.1 hypothetical protein DY000_02007677 [Brassica cretica]